MTNYGFTGEQEDSSGLLYLRARYYAPSQGRFFQPDPSRQEMNPYQYGLGNPVMYTDPTDNSACILAMQGQSQFMQQCIAELSSAASAFGATAGSSTAAFASYLPFVLVVGSAMCIFSTGEVFGPGWVTQEEVAAWQLEYQAYANFHAGDWQAELTRRQELERTETQAQEKIHQEDIPPILYHYTDAEGYAGIIESQTVWASTKINNPADARHGDGQYFTAVSPEMIRAGEYTVSQLGSHLFNRPNPYLRKLQYFIEINVVGLPIEAVMPPWIYLHKSGESLSINDRILRHGPTNWRSENYYLDKE